VGCWRGDGGSGRMCYWAECSEVSFSAPVRIWGWMGAVRLVWLVLSWCSSPLMWAGPVMKCWERCFESVRVGLTGESVRVRVGASVSASVVGPSRRACRVASESARVAHWTVGWPPRTMW
jgi:hypothetical protein